MLWRHYGIIALWLLAGSLSAQTLEPINSIAVHPDGKHLIIGGNRGMFRIWQIDPPREIAKIVHPGNVQYLSVSSDGKYVATGGTTCTLFIWNIQKINEPRQVAKFESDSQDILGVAFSPKGRWIASCGDDGLTRLWEFAGGSSGSGGLGKIVGARAPGEPRDQKQSRFVVKGHSDKTWLPAFTPDDKYLVTGSSDNTAKVWDMSTAPPSVIHTISDHDSTVMSLAFSADGKRAVTGSLDQSAIVWDFSNPREPVLVHRMKKHERGIYAVAISPNGRYVATGSSDKLGNLWDLDGREPKLMGVLEGHEDAVEALAFSPDNKRLFSGSHDGKIRIWLVDGSEFKAGPILPDAAQPD